jgi:hypothetical protein
MKILLISLFIFILLSIPIYATSIGEFQQENRIEILSQTGLDIYMNWTFKEINNTHWLASFDMPTNIKIKNYPLIALTNDIILSKNSIDQTKENSFYIIFPKGFKEGEMAKFGYESTIIETGVSNMNTQRMPQRKLFNINGYYWAFYCNNTYFGYKTSSDGTTWSLFTNVSSRACTNAHEFEVNWFPEWNSSQFFFIFAGGQVLQPVKMWRANISGSSLLIESEKTITLGSSFLSFNYPAIGVSITGHLYASFNRGIGAVHRWVLYNNSNNDGSGTWTLNATFSNNALGLGVYYNGGIYPLLNGDMINIYGDELSIFYKYYNATTTKWIEETILNQYCYKSFGAVEDGIGNIYFSCVHQANFFNPIYYKFNTSYQWSDYENVTTWNTDGFINHLSLDNSTKDVYVLFENYTTNKIIYVKRNNLTASWDTPTIWQTDSTILSYTIQPIKYVNIENKIGVIWNNGAYLNNTLQFDEISTIITPPSENITKYEYILINPDRLILLNIDNDNITTDNCKYQCISLANSIKNSKVIQYFGEINCLIEWYNQDMKNNNLCINLNSSKMIYIKDYNYEKNMVFNSYWSMFHAFLKSIFG